MRNFLAILIYQSGHECVTNTSEKKILIKQNSLVQIFIYF